MKRMCGWGALWLLLVLPVVIGCGGGKEGQMTVTGSVTLDGQPLESGRIIFMPKEKGSATATSGGGKIENGKYEAEVSSGKMGVSIRASKDVPIENPSEEDKARGLTTRPESIIPARYNDKSELEADVSSSSREFDFDLKSDASGE